nr:hypothetical protein GCM10017611_05910 [Rhodococcus wratislaviensis]
MSDSRAGQARSDEYWEQQVSIEARGPRATERAQSTTAEKPASLADHYQPVQAGSDTDQSAWDEPSRLTPDEQYPGQHRRPGTGE